MSKRRVVAWMTLGLACGWFGHAQESGSLEVRAVSPDALFEYEEETGTVSDPLGVSVRYGDAVLQAKRVRVNRQTGEVLAEGEVRLQRGGELWTGERLRYNFATREMQGEYFRTGISPFFAAGEGLRADLGGTNQLPAQPGLIIPGAEGGKSALPSQSHSATNAFVTTDDVEQPGYRVRAKSLKFVPGEVIEAKHATLYLGNVPVMYFPIYRRHLNRHPSYWAFEPGYRSLYGPYLLSTYHWAARTNLSADVRLDYRQRRGVAGGPGVTYDFGKAGQGTAEGYVADDDRPGQSSTGKPIDETRHRIAFAHSAYLGTNFTAKLALRQQSDEFIIRDLMEDEYRKDPQPKSFLEVTKLWPNFGLSLYAQPQVNDFFETVERLPEAKLTALRQQIGHSPLWYEGENSVGYYRFRAPDDLTEDYAAMRADSYHQVVLPQNYFGWLNVAPRVGGRFTYYGEEDGRGSMLDEQHRSVLNTGAEVSTKASRVWPYPQSKLFEVNGLRHIIEPSVNYVYVPTPSKAPSEVPQFDREFPTFRLQPIDFPDYNSVDSIDSQNVMRLGLRNKLQTKRNGQVDNLVHWALLTDWRIDPQRKQSTFADLYSDLDLRPRSWLTLNSETRYGPEDGYFKMANHTATFELSDAWSWTVGHRYLKDGTDLGLGNNVFLSRFTFKLNENWAFRMNHHFEARDGTLEEQRYTVYRDFRSWTAALSFRMRQGRGAQEDDYTVAVTFSLKAVPRYKLNRDRDTYSLLLGG